MRTRTDTCWAAMSRRMVRSSSLPAVLTVATIMYCGCAAPPPDWLAKRYGVDIGDEAATGRALATWFEARGLPLRTHAFRLYPYFFEAIGWWLILSRTLLAAAIVVR